MPGIKRSFPSRISSNDPRKDRADPLVAAIDKGTKVDSARLKIDGTRAKIDSARLLEQKKHSKKITMVMNMEAYTKMSKERTDLQVRKEAIVEKVVNAMPGSTRKKKKKSFKEKKKQHEIRMEERGGADSDTDESNASQFDTIAYLEEQDHLFDKKMMNAQEDEKEEEKVVDEEDVNVDGNKEKDDADDDSSFVVDLTD